MLGDLQPGRAGELVGLAGHEGGEGEGRIEAVRRACARRSAIGGAVTVDGTSAAGSYPQAPAGAGVAAAARAAAQRARPDAGVGDGERRRCTGAPAAAGASARCGRRSGPSPTAGRSGWARRRVARVRRARRRAAGSRCRTAAASAPARTPPGRLPATGNGRHAAARFLAVMPSERRQRRPGQGAGGTAAVHADDLRLRAWIVVRRARQLSTGARPPSLRCCSIARPGRVIHSPNARDRQSLAAAALRAPVAVDSRGITRSNVRLFQRLGSSRLHETHVPALQVRRAAHARLSRAHENGRRPQGALGAARQGPQARSPL